MISYWINLVYLMGMWTLGIFFNHSSHTPNPTEVLLSALFFLCYFSLTLLKEKPMLNFLAYIIINSIVYVVFLNTGFNGFAIGIFFILTYVSVHTFTKWQLLFHCVFQVMLVIPSLITYIHNYHILWILCMMVVVYTWLYTLQETVYTLSTLNQGFDQIQRDYRRLKRQVGMNEKNLRQEERNQVARDLHDSVGHRLTALLMQLEVARIQSQDEIFLEKIIHLKTLAQESLEETRLAVKTLKNDESTGLSAVMQLIRKLESESHLQISFHVKSGAHSFPMTSNQSVVLYRSVQESLTNMMRHAHTRDAEVEFSVVGEQFFRFQISNPLNSVVDFTEGFGLTSMRERLEQVKGTLNISQANGRFTVMGMFPSENEVTYDINTDC